MQFSNNEVFRTLLSERLGHLCEPKAIRLPIWAKYGLEDEINPAEQTGAKCRLNYVTSTTTEHFSSSPFRNVKVLNNVGEA